MVRRLARSLPPLLAAVVLLAGCGSSSSSSSSTGSGAVTGTISGTVSQTSSSSTAPPATSTSPTTTTGTSATTGSSASPTPPSAANAVASCKRGVQSLPHLKQSIRKRLETICEKAAAGDVKAKRKAAQEACRELVNASPLPAGEARDRALAACKNAGGAGK